MEKRRNKKIIDASDFLRRKNKEDNFITWFNGIFPNLETRFTRLSREIFEKLARDSWLKCEEIWKTKIIKRNKVIAAAIETCPCEDMCSSCSVLGGLLDKRLD